MCRRQFQSKLRLAGWYSQVNCIETEPSEQRRIECGVDRGVVENLVEENWELLIMVIKYPFYWF